MEPAEVEARFDAAMVALSGRGHEARIGVAVSGGPDSMALLALAARAFPDRVAAATIDHGLRTEAADEAAMVARWCAEHQLSHATLRPDQPIEGNIQAGARTVRYALLEQWRATQGIDHILTAHHADDQLETLLMRLNRGAGLSGLAGVRQRSGVVLRPLLGLRKADLIAYARARSLPFVEDPSNADPRFDRAALRAHLATVEWLDPLAAVRSAAALADAEVALDWMVEEIATRHVRHTGDEVRLDSTNYPREIQRRLLLRMVALADPTAPIPRGDAIDRLIASASNGAQASIGAFLLSGGAVWTLRPAPERRAG
jgi:tRNA(Ile)-lysidine synthase